MTAYAALLARLVTTRRFGVVFGLVRVQEVLDRLGNPERRMGTIVHVGGTNGKGSTVAILAALVRASGRRVATYTSPHLSSLRERIAFDGVPIDEAALLASAAAVSGAGGDELTFFEQITAIGFHAIAAHGAEVAIIEVGLGGRLDATNVVAAPIAIVTGVALDHEAILGTTLAAIAGEKAGIWKPGQHVVVGASGEPSAVALLLDAARAVGPASLAVIDDAAIAAVPPVALHGAHQRANAAAALAAFARLGLVADVPAALASVVHPGRFERVGDDVILDGAHNPHGAAALAATLAARGERPVLIIAVSADKDVAALVGAIAPQCARVIATRYQQDRAMDPVALAALITGATHAPDLAAALALARAQPIRPIVVAGSLFLVGEARTLLLGAPTDPIWASDPHARR